MHVIKLSVAAALALATAPLLHSQDLSLSTLTASAATAASAPAPALRAETTVVLSMAQDVTTHGGQWKEGDLFHLNVTTDVYLNGKVVIPQGSDAVGRIVTVSGIGNQSTSEKLIVRLEYVQVEGRNIPLTGTFRQEGEGYTVASVAGGMGAGIFADFSTHKSATIPQGRELVAHLEPGLLLTDTDLLADTDQASLMATGNAAVSAARH